MHFSWNENSYIVLNSLWVLGRLGMWASQLKHSSNIFYICQWIVAFFSYRSFCWGFLIFSATLVHLFLSFYSPHICCVTTDICKTEKRASAQVTHPFCLSLYCHSQVYISKERQNLFLPRDQLSCLNLSWRSTWEHLAHFQLLLQNARSCVVAASSLWTPETSHHIPDHVRCLYWGNKTEQTESAMPGEGTGAASGGNQLLLQLAWLLPYQTWKQQSVTKGEH